MAQLWQRQARFERIRQKNKFRVASKQSNAVTISNFISPSVFKESLVLKRVQPRKTCSQQCHCHLGLKPEVRNFNASNKYIK